jgi:tetratricopeptide (TPR) repeat protein
MKKADLKRSVIAHRNDRMGARIISILNAIRLSRDYDIPWFCGWTTGGRTYEECRDPTFIFDDDFVARKFFDDKLLRSVYDELIDISTVEGSKTTQEEFLAPLANGKNYLSGAAMGVTVLPWENPEQVAANLPLCMGALEYSAPVRAMIGEIETMFADTHLTAFHIRRGDIINEQIASNKLWPNKYIPREFYEVLLERLLENPTSQVLVFSDTPEEVDRLKEKSDRVLGVSDLFGARDFTPGARDFLELFAMSRCQHIYGPPSSAYSQTAMLIGGCTLQAVQDALSPQEYDTAMERMSKRLEEKSPLFINMGDVGQCLHFQIEYHMARGTPQRAKKIIKSYMDDGLDKSFAYQLLCELSVTSNDLPYVEKIRDMAYARPVYVDDSMAVVNTYSGMHHLVEGDWAMAQSRFLTAMWYRPLDPMVHGGLNTALSAGAIDPENFYPFDPRLVRRKGAVFPMGKASLAALNGLVPKGMQSNDRPLFHPWEIVVRDWRAVSGRRLNRAFTNNSKIAKTRKMLAQSFQKMNGTASLQSALSVLDNIIGNTQDAIDAQRQAVSAEPENPLFHKRMADLLFEMGDTDTALTHLEHAAALSDQHPCYLADSAERLWAFKDRRGDARGIYDKLAQQKHGFVEIHILTANMLRRDKTRCEEALAELDKGEILAHGALRIMTPKAKLYMTLGRMDDAIEIYEQITDWGLGTVHTFQNVYRQFEEIDRLDLARHIIGRSNFEFEAVQQMAR